MNDPVQQPSHYFADNGLEAIDVIEAFFHDNYFLGNVFKYIARAGKKDPAKHVEDLRKAMVYLDHEIGRVSIQIAFDNTVFFGETEVKEPRVWRTIADVPIALTVRSDVGFPWIFDPATGWRMRDFDGPWEPSDPNWRVNFGPWTEVL